MNESPYRQAAVEALRRMNDGPWYLDDLRRVAQLLVTDSGAARAAGSDARSLSAWLAALGPVGKLELLQWANRERLRALSGKKNDDPGAEEGVHPSAVSSDQGLAVRET